VKAKTRVRALAQSGTTEKTKTEKTRTTKLDYSL
jgi:hypothetical protein